MRESVHQMGTPSVYANSVRKQQQLATGKVWNCYRTGFQPIPLSLLYAFFGDFASAHTNLTNLARRDILFVQEMCQKMRAFDHEEINRELRFGSLLQEYLQHMLSTEVEMQHQRRGESIVDIRLQAKV